MVFMHFATMHLGFKTTVAENNFAHTHHFYVHYQLTHNALRF